MLKSMTMVEKTLEKRSILETTKTILDKIILQVLFFYTNQENNI